jgi:hypothetical protein
MRWHDREKPVNIKMKKISEDEVRLHLLIEVSRNSDKEIIFVPW